jgi:hypothetical protein
VKVCPPRTTEVGAEGVAVWLTKTATSIARLRFDATVIATLSEDAESALPVAVTL